MTMRFTVVTLFPEMFASVLSTSILGKARDAGLIEVSFVDPREFTTDRHRTADDAPYGGGPGMVMKPEPLVAAIEAAVERGGGRGRRILLSASGTPFNHPRAVELSGEDHIVLVCGRYEGIDRRVVDLAIDEELSIGDYVLTGGELGAMTIIDAVSRFVPGVLGDGASTEEESYADDLLEYPQYTRPAEFRGLQVPPVLTSGNHAAIARWRRERSIDATAQRRPDLLRRHHLAGDAAWSDHPANWAKRCYLILAHHPIWDRDKNIVTTSVTNMDVHDIARSSTTYGLSGYFLVTPVTSQREKVQRILDVWNRDAYIDNREQALAVLHTVSTIEDALSAIADVHGARPHVVGTSARPDQHGLRAMDFEPFARERAADPAPTAILFGTGWGLADPAMALCDSVLPPVAGQSDFNHLSVRSAVAVVLDRLLGSDPGHPSAPSEGR